MGKSYGQLVSEAQARVRATTPQALSARIQARGPLVVIDVREPQEWSAGLLPGALAIPRGVLEGQVDGHLPRDAEIVLYCAAGARSALAAVSLEEMGYTRVEHLEGGFGAWARAGLAIERSRA